MHEMAVFWLRMATALYGVGLLHVMAVLLRRREGFLKPALFAFLIAAVLHFVAIVELSVAIGHLPVDNFFESATVCAFLIAVLFLFVYWRYDAASLSVCIFPLVFVLTQVGAMESPISGWPSTNIRALLLVHVMMVLLGYASLLLTAVASLFYLIQERHLKRKQPLDLPAYFAQLFKRLPPLATLDNLITNAMSFGFVFITLGVIAGSTWAFIDAGTAWIRDPRIALAFITWGFYLTMVFLRQTAGWRGRKAALMAVAVLCCSGLTWAAHVGLRSLLAK
jgi:ABC-type transport system involved in cytochrome c biogenesis permease subunit